MKFRSFNQTLKKYFVIMCVGLTIFRVSIIPMAELSLILFGVDGVIGFAFLMYVIPTIIALATIIFLRLTTKILFAPKMVTQIFGIHIMIAIVFWIMLGPLSVNTIIFAIISMTPVTILGMLFLRGKEIEQSKTHQLIKFNDQEINGFFKTKQIEASGYFVAIRKTNPLIVIGVMVTVFFALVFTRSSGAFIGGAMVVIPSFFSVTNIIAYDLENVYFLEMSFLSNTLISDWQVINQSEIEIKEVREKKRSNIMFLETVDNNYRFIVANTVGKGLPEQETNFRRFIKLFNKPQSQEMK